MQRFHRGTSNTTTYTTLISLDLGLLHFESRKRQRGFDIQGCKRSAIGVLVLDWLPGWRQPAGRRYELYSGKHHTTGLHIQVVCDLAGRLRWISDPVEGCRHDSAALRGSGVRVILPAPAADQDAIDDQLLIARQAFGRLG